jgi:hypothetical protein
VSEQFLETRMNKWNQSLLLHSNLYSAEDIDIFYHIDSQASDPALTQTTRTSAAVDLGLD